MRILLDCSQIRKGGGIQAALSVLGHAAEDDERQWHVVLSSELAAQVPAERRKAFQTCSALPRVRNALTRRLSPGRHLPQIEMAVRPDVVFTLFGPAWWRARASHVVGFARGLMLCPYRTTPGRTSLRAGLQQRIEYWLRARDFRRADLLVAETETIRSGAARVVGFPVNRVLVVRNSYGADMKPPRFTLDARASKQILVPASYYPHKNLEFIPPVARALRTRGIHGVEFVLTLPADGEGWRRIQAAAGREGVDDIVRTVGTVKHKDMAELYFRSAAVFLPTLFESSTAVYPEAFLMGVPLVTSDLPFARDLCGDAALFVDPLSPDDAAGALTKILTNGRLRETLVEHGKVVLRANYPTPEAKWRAQLEMLELAAGWGRTVT